MSVTPSETYPPEGDAPPKQFRWYHKVAGLLLVILCFEVGIFLVAFPWSSYWNINYFSGLSPAWEAVWASPYARGAVTGLGVVNLYVSLIEVFRLQRFSADSE